MNANVEGALKPDPSVLLSRVQARDYMISKGYHVGNFVLAYLASVLRGPRFLYIEGRARYNVADIDEWLASPDVPKTFTRGNTFDPKRAKRA